MQKYERVRVKKITVQIDGGSLEAPPSNSSFVQKLTSGQHCKLLQKHSPQKNSERNLKKQDYINLLILCCFWQCLLEVFLFHTINCIVAYKHLFKEHFVCARCSRQLSMLTQCSMGAVHGQRLQKC